MKKLLEFHWKNRSIFQELTAPKSLQAWVLHKDSFMERLRLKGAHDPQIHVLLQAWQPCESWEREVLKLPLNTETLVREVLILSENKYWMFARSIFPQETLTGQERELADLKNRPLGSFLFNHPDMQRSDFSFDCLSNGMRWHQKVRDDLHHFVQLNEQEELWSRYSIFYLKEKSLLLTEIFLPDLSEL